MSFCVLASIRALSEALLTTENLGIDYLVRDLFNKRENRKIRKRLWSCLNQVINSIPEEHQERIIQNLMDILSSKVQQLRGRISVEVRESVNRQLGLPVYNLDEEDDPEIAELNESLQILFECLDPFEKTELKCSKWLVSIASKRHVNEYVRKFFNEKEEKFYNNCLWFSVEKFIKAMSPKDLSSFIKRLDKYINDSAQRYETFNIRDEEDLRIGTLIGVTFREASQILHGCLEMQKLLPEVMRSYYEPKLFPIVAEYL